MFCFLAENKRNRGSQECLTTLNKNFSLEQKGADGDMGMQSLMNVHYKNLNSVLCDWLARKYDVSSKCFVIPGRDRIPLDEESVFNTLGVPRGGMDVPYKVAEKSRRGCSLICSQEWIRCCKRVLWLTWLRK